MNVRVSLIGLLAALLLAAGCSHSATSSGTATGVLASLAREGGGKTVFVEFYSPT